MLSPSTFRPLIATGLFAALVAACTFDSGPTGQRPGSGPPPGNTAPMVVVVDTGKTLSATPGDGVGVFVEYVAGGSWHVWWSCDTSRSGQSCPFAITVDGASPLSNLAGENVIPEKLTQPSGTRVQVTSTVSQDLAGMTFKTQAGARITVTAVMGGLQTGDFMFFVQDGVINGGFQGPLTNPLTFEPSVP